MAVFYLQYGGDKECKETIEKTVTDVEIGILLEGDIFCHNDVLYWKLSECKETIEKTRFVLFEMHYIGNYHNDARHVILIEK